MRVVKINDSVIMPDPSITDLWTHSFIGRIESIENGLANVVDKDDDSYEIEIERLIKE